MECLLYCANPLGIPMLLASGFSVHPERSKPERLFQLMAFSELANKTLFF